MRLHGVEAGALDLRRAVVACFRLSTVRVALARGTPARRTDAARRRQLSAASFVTAHCARIADASDAELDATPASFDGALADDVLNQVVRRVAATLLSTPPSSAAGVSSLSSSSSSAATVAALRFSGSGLRVSSSSAAAAAGGASATAPPVTSMMSVFDQFDAAPKRATMAAVRRRAHAPTRADSRGA